MTELKRYTPGALSALFDVKPVISQIPAAPTHQSPRSPDTDADDKNVIEDELSVKPSSTGESSWRRDELNKLYLFCFLFVRYTEEKESEQSRTIFVGNVPLSVDKRVLKKLFRQYGKIEAIRYRSVAVPQPNMPKKVAVIRRQTHAGCDAVNAYVRFANEVAAQDAVQVNGHTLSDHRLRVNGCWQSANVDSKRSVYVTNLPYDCSDDQLYGHFEECGAVESVRVVRDKFSRMGKGFGFVCFAQAYSVDAALAISERTMGDRTVYVHPVLKKTQVVKNRDRRLQLEKRQKKKTQQPVGVPTRPTKGIKVVGGGSGTSSSITAERTKKARFVQGLQPKSKSKFHRKQRKVNEMNKKKKSSSLFAT